VCCDLLELSQLENSLPRVRGATEVLDSRELVQEGLDALRPLASSAAYSSAFRATFQPALGGFVPPAPALLQPVGQRCGATGPDPRVWWRLRFAGANSGGSWRSATTGCGLQRRRLERC